MEPMLKPSVEILVFWKPVQSGFSAIADQSRLIEIKGESKSEFMDSEDQ